MIIRYQYKKFQTELDSLLSVCEKILEDNCFREFYAELYEKCQFFYFEIFEENKKIITKNVKEKFVERLTFYYDKCSDMLNYCSKWEHSKLYNLKIIIRNFQKQIINLKLTIKI